jgi:signal transduction histidine kinase
LQYFDGGVPCLTKFEVLAKTAGYMDRFVKEATEIRLHANNINREKGFKLVVVAAVVVVVVVKMKYLRING